MLKKWFYEKTAKEAVENLRAHGFDAHYYGEVASAREKALDLIKGFNSFGIGGSDTVRAMGIVEELKKMGKIVYDHWVDGLRPEEDLEIRLRQGRAECFISSANAISKTGEIVNVDGIGNRVTGTIFGPKKVLILAGINKVRPDLPSALNRVKEIAGPMRAKSLNRNTPCVETGTCHDCNSPQRICRITTILHRKPALTDISVVIVGEELGF